MRPTFTRVEVASVCVLLATSTDPKNIVSLRSLHTVKVMGLVTGTTCVYRTWSWFGKGVMWSQTHSSLWMASMKGEETGMWGASGNIPDV